MKKRSFFICILIISIFVVACRWYPWSDVHTYYCEGRDVTFKILEKDTVDILVFDDTDSIYMPAKHGNYLGLQFHIPEDSDIIYYEVHNYPRLYRYVENKYKIKLLKFGINGKWEHRYLVDFDEKDLQEYFEALDNHHAWGFNGHLRERGAGYSFGVWHDSLYQGSLYPLEWK